MVATYAMPILLAVAALITIVGDMAGFSGTVQLVAMVVLLASVGLWVLWQTAAARQLAADLRPDWLETGLPGPFLVFVALVSGLAFSFATLSETLEDEGGVLAVALSGGEMRRAQDGEVESKPVTTVRIEPPAMTVAPTEPAPTATVSLPQEPLPSGPLVIEEVVAVSERQMRPVIINRSGAGFDRLQLYVAAVRLGEEAILLNITDQTLGAGETLTPLVLIEDIGDDYLVCAVARNTATGGWVRSARRFGPLAATVNDRLAPDGPGISEDVAAEAVCG